MTVPGIGAGTGLPEPAGAGAAGAFAGSFSRYHGLLRSQLAAPLEKYCSHRFAAEFIAESLLTWSMAGKDYDEIYNVLQKLF